MSMQASLTSKIPRSGPPVTLIRIPRAPVMVMSSSRGLEMARFHRALLSLGRPRPHERHAHLAHHRPHVGEVQVDQPFHGDQVGDSLHRLEQDLIGLAESLQQGHVFAGDVEEPLVGDGDQGVHAFAQFLQPFLGLALPLLAFEEEGLGDHGHGERPRFLGDAGQDRSPAGSGSAAHAGGDEDHVRSGEDLMDPVAVLQGGVSPDFGDRPRPQSFGQAGSQLDLDRGAACRQGLGIGVGADEFHPLQAGLDHGIDGVASPSADPHHLQVGPGLLILFHFKHPPTSLKAISDCGFRIAD
jgi:hypothetical protein